MFEGKKAAIFDLDGTLIDSMGIWEDADRRIIEKRGKVFPKNFLSEIDGMTYDQAMVYIAEKYGLPGETAEVFHKEYKEIIDYEYLHVVQNKPHSWDFVRYCKSLGLKVGLATGCKKSTVMQILEKNGVSDVFDSVRVSSECDKPKPAPDVYLLVLKDLEVDPKECIAFEDIPSGIKSGQAAGIAVCAVQDDFSEKFVDEKKKLAEYYSNSYEDLINGKYETLK